MFHLLKIIPDISIYKFFIKRKKTSSEAFRDVGSGVVVAVLLAFIFEQSLSYLQLCFGLVIGFFLWYISSELAERSK
jgi:hypothetical protein